MVELCHHLDLARESVAAHRGRQFGAQHLERHLPAVLLVLGEIHRGHAVCTHLALDGIPVGQCFGESRVGGRHRQILRLCRATRDPCGHPVATSRLGREHMGNRGVTNGRAR